MVANLASEYGCSNSCSFRDMTFFKDFFFQNFSENLGMKNFAKFEIIISVMRVCQGTHMISEFCRSI